MSEEQMGGLENVTIAQIQDVLTKRVSAYKHVGLVIDYEGVLLPYAYPSLFEQSRTASMEMRLRLPRVYEYETPEMQVRSFTSQLPTNEPLLQLLKKVAASIGDKITVIPGSELESSPSSPFFTPLLRAGIERGRTLLHQIAPLQFQELYHELSKDSLLIFFNDNVDAGQPPNNLLMKIRKIQPHFASFTSITVPVPRFALDIKGNQYAQKLYAATYEGLLVSPKFLRVGKSKQEEKQVTPFHSQRRVLREGD